VKHTSRYPLLDRAGFCPSKVHQNDELGPTIRTVGNFLALLFLIFGTAFTTYVPASLAERIGGFLFLGLVPAVGLCMGGHILGHLLVVCEALGAVIVARCFRGSVFLAKCFLILIGSCVSGASIGCLLLLVHVSLSKLSDLGQKTWSSIRDRCRRGQTAFIEYLCLLIRGGARFVIRMGASRARWVSHVPRGGWGLWPLIRKGMFLTAFGLGWCGGHIWFLELKREDSTGKPAIGAVVKQTIGTEDGVAIESVVERIIGIESDGDPNATNKRSSALGLGQFLDETWLDLIRSHRPDLARGRSKDETLQLRRDTKIAREITLRFTEQNAEMLRKRSLPVTPGTLYLAHFAGGAGAVAILSALDDADAASVMASADVTGRTKREKIVQANSFLERFTVVDLKSWADRKMRLPGS
jgi:hypothetical protein